MSNKAAFRDPLSSSSAKHLFGTATRSDLQGTSRNWKADAVSWPFGSVWKNPRDFCQQTPNEIGPF